jgi:hypothetical protein
MISVTAFVVQANDVVRAISSAGLSIITHLENRHVSLPHRKLMAE